MANKARHKKYGKAVEYMVFTPEDFPIIEKWADIKIETTDMKEIYSFAGHGFVYHNIPKFSYLVKRNDGSLAVFDVIHFQECFEKTELNDIDKALGEHPEIRAQIENAVADYQAQAKVKAQKEFSLIPELEELLRYFKDAQHIILDNDPEKEQMRKDAATDALYNFCRGLVIGAKIARQ